MGIESIGYVNVGTGARQHYGPRTTESRAPADHTTYGRERELAIVFDYDTLPDNQAIDAVVQAIPAYSVLTSCVLQVITPFAGGTSYDIGLQTLSGTEIDNDGLFDGVVLADIDAIGDTPIANGALLPAWVSTGNAETIRPMFVDIGAAAGQVTVAATGTFTAGRARLIIKYLPLN